MKGSEKREASECVSTVMQRRVCFYCRQTILRIPRCLRCVSIIRYMDNGFKYSYDSTYRWTFFFLFFFLVLKFYSIDESYKFVLAIFVSQKKKKTKKNLFRLFYFGLFRKSGLLFNGMQHENAHILRYKIEKHTFSAMITP